MKKIAIIGAAGFIGQHLVSLLSGKNYEVTAFTNQNGKMILGKYPVKIIESFRANSKDVFDLVINLAFPASAKPYEISEQNDKILNVIKNLVSPSTKIIHISTIAVFGYGLDYEQILGPVKMRNDFPYIESKIYIENELIKNFRENKLHIIRIGNVWGPNSAGWTLAIAKRLFFLLPFCARDLIGFSNVTEVRNVASYIEFLINDKAADLLNFHHLAEFSDYHWTSFIDELEELLKVQAKYEEIKLDYSLNLKTDIRKIMLKTSPLRQARTILESRFMGAYLRTFLNILTDKQQKKIEEKYSQRSLIRESDSSVFLNVLSAQNQFINRILPQWEGPVSFRNSINDVGNWLNEIGFCVKAQG